MKLPNKISLKWVVLTVAGIIVSAFLWTMGERRANRYFDGTANPND